MKRGIDRPHHQEHDRPTKLASAVWMRDAYQEAT
jgi:hypothetical protein